MDSYLKEIRKFKPLSKAEEYDLFVLAKEHDNKAAYEKLITSNLRFVVSVAKKYQNQGLDLEELIEEGNLGLVKAFYKFDITRNVKFITYAVWWIKQSIINAIHENSKTIRLPLNKIVNLTKAARLKYELEQELVRPIDMSEMQEYIDDPEILEDLKYSYTQIDLDKPRTDNERNLNCILEDEGVANPEEAVELVIDELQEVLKGFTHREREIIYMYFGIGRVRNYTLKEIGIDMGLTRERIRQIKEKALERLKDSKHAERLRSYL